MNLSDLDSQFWDGSEVKGVLGSSYRKHVPTPFEGTVVRSTRVSVWVRIRPEGRFITRQKPSDLHVLKKGPGRQQ